MSYPPKLAAALSGATLAQLSHWRSPSASGGAVLVPEIASGRPRVLYSFRDLVALRTCVMLRQEASLQRIRRALGNLRVGLGLTEHLSAYQIVGDGTSIYLVDRDQATDLLKRPGNQVIADAVDVLRPFVTKTGREVPDLLHPRPHVSVDPEVRGGEPVISGSRVPYWNVATLVQDGIPPEQISTFYPNVSAAGAMDAADFAAYVDTYAPRQDRGPEVA